jgi:acyl-coenzyme A thioesterase PaaI-like protein
MTVTEPRDGVPTDVRQPKLSLAQVRELLADFMPEAGLHVVEVSPHRVVVMALPEWLETRPGGTLSGPAIFKAVDLSAFLAVNAYAGRVLTGVLTNGSINLLETAEPGPLEIVLDVAKLGRRMAVVTAQVFDTDSQLIAVSTMQFALPSRPTRSIAD